MRCIRDLSTLVVYGIDGQVGSIQDFYFDHTSWAVRYFAVRTGEWYSGRVALIAPFAVAGINSGNASMRIHLRKEQIAQAPPLDASKPISRQREEDYFQHYRWEPYWQADATGWAGPTYYPDASIMILSKPLIPEPLGPLRLCRTWQMIGYEIRTEDGVAGQVKDLLVDEERWVVRYLEIEVDMLDRSSGNTVLAETRRVQQIDHQSHSITMGLSLHAIRSAPAYDRAELMTPNYEIDLFKHYGQVT